MLTIPVYYLYSYFLTLNLFSLSNYPIINVNFQVPLEDVTDRACQVSFSLSSFYIIDFKVTAFFNKFFTGASSSTANADLGSMESLCTAINHLSSGKEGEGSAFSQYL